MKRFITIITLALTLAACGSTSTTIPAPTPVQLDGIYGGYLTYQGQTLAAFAVEINTTQNGVVDGWGLITFDGYTEIYLDVRGNTTASNDIHLTLEDNYGDSLRLSGGWDGSHARGKWSTSFDNTTGSFVFTHEDDIDTLAVGELTQSIAVNPGEPGPLDANGSIREAMQ